jgi:phage-related protein
MSRPTWARGLKRTRPTVRVVYFNLTEQGTIILITLYKKSDQANIQASDIQKTV